MTIITKKVIINSQKQIIINLPEQIIQSNEEAIHILDCFGNHSKEFYAALLVDEQGGFFFGVNMSDNLELFDFPKFKITQKIRLIELFGGIGSQAMALRDIGADFEHYRLVEFDKYAIASYNSIHGTQFETSDIKNVHGADLGITEKDKYCYLMTYSFPCQDLSVAGKQQGMKKGGNTRSGLLWEVERILNELNQEDLPQVLLMKTCRRFMQKKTYSILNHGFLFCVPKVITISGKTLTQRITEYRRTGSGASVYRFFLNVLLTISFRNLLSLKRL